MPGPGARPDDLFVIPREDGTFFLYAPLRRGLAVVNRAAADAVARHLSGGPGPVPEAAAKVLAELRERGLIGGTPPEPPLFPPDYEIRPHEVTLFLTSRCNLRCRYCYAEAGRKAVDMPWEVARAAIDLVAANAGLLGSETFAVGFHGGGEPTVAWDLLQRSVGHARETAERLGLRAEIFAATNGLLDAARRDFIVRNFSTVNVSLDGPPDVQDRNRRSAAGGGSFEAVRETLEAFDAAGFHYGIRATITSATVERMEEIVEFFDRRFKFKYLHLEPVWECGRCATTGETAPPAERFVENFLRVARAERASNVEVFYSGARLDTLTSKFCAASGDGFTVLPEGLVTSCYEITEASDPRAAVFHYGRYDAAAGGFVFDRERLTALRRLSVEHLPFCGDCFCKWHCAGDCLAKAFERSGGPVHAGTARCRLNRSLTLARLDDLARAETAGAAAPAGPGE